MTKVLLVVLASCLAAGCVSSGSGQYLTTEELGVYKKKAEYELGTSPSDYYFQGVQTGPRPPRPGCILVEAVDDPDSSGLHHAEWQCPRN